jgi:hypothetical protein
MTEKENKMEKTKKEVKKKEVKEKAPKKSIFKKKEKKKEVRHQFSKLNLRGLMFQKDRKDLMIKRQSLL